MFGVFFFEVIVTMTLGSIPADFLYKLWFSSLLQRGSPCRLAAIVSLYAQRRSLFDLNVFQPDRF